MEKTNSAQIFTSLFYLIILSFLIESNCYHSMKDLIPSHYISSSSNQSVQITGQRGDDFIEEQVDFQYVSLFDQIIAQQDSYRKMVNFEYSHFKSYYTFMKSQDSSDFYLSYPAEQLVKGQIHLFWKDGSNNQLEPIVPQYNLGQYAILTIQSYNELTNQTVIIHQKSFYVQSGFSFLATPNIKYKLKFYNYGKVDKLISFFVSHVQPLHSMINFGHQNSTIKQVEMKGEYLYNELEAIFTRNQYQSINNQNILNKIWSNVVKYYYCDILQALLVFLLMALQVKIMFPLQKREQSII